jgi:hypothetical protein
MQGCFLAIVGLIFGAMLGAMLGVGLGFAYTKILNVSDFEGYSGMLIFFTFMPLGAIAGGIGGAILLGIVGARKLAMDANDLLGRSQHSTTRQLLGGERTYRKHRRVAEVCFRGQSGKHLLTLSFIGFDRYC